MEHDVIYLPQDLLHITTHSVPHCEPRQPRGVAVRGRCGERRCARSPPRAAGSSVACRSSMKKSRYVKTDKVFAPKRLYLRRFTLETLSPNRNHVLLSRLHLGPWGTYLVRRTGLGLFAHGIAHQIACSRKKKRYYQFRKKKTSVSAH